MTKQPKKASVVNSPEDFKSNKETTHLKSSIKNANRLNHAIKELEAKKNINND